MSVKKLDAAQEEAAYARRESQVCAVHGNHDSQKRVVALIAAVGGHREVARRRRKARSLIMRVKALSCAPRACLLYAWR